MKNNTAHIVIEKIDGTKIIIEECKYKINNYYFVVLCDNESLIYPLHDISLISIEYLD